jgi:hypothetical protein
MFVVPITVMTLKAFNDTGRIKLWKPADRNWGRIWKQLLFATAMMSITEYIN